MDKYIKKPVEIEAVQLTRENLSEVIHWVNDESAPKQQGDPPAKCYAYEDVTRPGVVISTLEGEMLAEFRDYVIRGVEGEFYPCKPSVFEASYDALA